MKPRLKACGHKARLRGLSYSWLVAEQRAKVWDKADTEREMGAMAKMSAYRG